SVIAAAAAAPPRTICRRLMRSILDECLTRRSQIQPSSKQSYSSGGSEGMASRDRSDANIRTETELALSIDSFSRRGLRDGMKRWTNGLPGATKRLGAKMALRGLAASQPGCARIPMMARSKLLHLRGLIH